jgi:hypothetical protein
MKFPPPPPASKPDLTLYARNATLRDYFAANALPYCLKNCFTRIGACDESYDIADLMLEARKK